MNEEHVLDVLLIMAFIVFAITEIRLRALEIEEGFVDCPELVEVVVMRMTVVSVLRLLWKGDYRGTTHRKA